MSTRSLIGFRDGHIHGIYCHYDGYPTHVGKILVQHHNSWQACQEIMDGGQIRNFDNDGTIVRFGDSEPGEDCTEVYSDVDEALNGCFDYVYLFDVPAMEWRCFTKEYSPFKIIKQEIIPA